METTATDTTDRAGLLARVFDPANRHDPYPLYARLREEPVSVQDDGTYVVSGYTELASLLHDPRISSDERKSDPDVPGIVSEGQKAGPELQGSTALLFQDPPEHDRLRAAVMAQFTPQRLRRMRTDITRLIDRLLDERRDEHRIDIVDELAYPLPVAVICKLLGVPPQDEPRFRGWAAALARALDPPTSMSREEVQQGGSARTEILEYLGGLVDDRRRSPQDDLLSALAGAEDPTLRLDDDDLRSTVLLLLVAGHETTVNLVANATLAMVRDPRLQHRVATEPGIEVTFMEEVLRYDPPVQFRTRTTLADLDVAGVHIPKGASVVLLLAAGSRDPAHFTDADRIVPARQDNQHLGFGGGLHYCIGAPLARLEGHAAIKAIARRIDRPRLLADPPPYRDNAALRGPEHLSLEFEEMRGWAVR